MIEPTRYPKMPTKKDLVEVVRCKDCKHRVKSHSSEYGDWCGITEFGTDDDDFCSNGERRDDGSES